MQTRISDQVTNPFIHPDLWIPMKAMYQSLIRLFVCVTLSVLAIASLFYYTDWTKRQNNHFTRILPPHMIYGAREVDLKMNSYHLSGLTNNYIILSNETAPAFLYLTNYNLTDSSHRILNFPYKLKIIPDGMQTVVDSPDIYCMEGITPAILHGNWNSNMMNSVKVDSLHFDNAIPISSSTFITRSIDTALNKNILIKTDINKHTILRATKLLEKQIDGIFSTDGMLSYDPNGKRIYYVYYYRNQFLCMDTNLNLIYKGKTIDTVSKAHLKIAELASHKFGVIAAPPLVVNKTSYVYGSYLLIHSNLRADNENKNILNSYSVVDMYNLYSGRYKFSFYIPNSEEGPMKSFIAGKGIFVALYDHSLMTFELHIPHSE